MESWVCDAGLLLKFVASPALTFENFLQCTDDHVGTIDQKDVYVNNLVYIKYTLHIEQSRYNRLEMSKFVDCALRIGVKGLAGGKSLA
jgi:hypothetical protein